MPIYEWMCPACDTLYSEARSISQYEADPDRYCMCTIKGTKTNRFYTPPAVKPMMHEHYNASTGQLVSSARQHADQLKAASDAATARTGIEHRFVPHDLHDTAAIGVDEAGLDATRRKRRALGLDVGPKVL